MEKFVTTYGEEVTGVTKNSKGKFVGIGTCGRCNGSGHYSFCTEHGTKCFGCSGSGKAYERAYNAKQFAAIEARRAKKQAVRDAVNAAYQIENAKREVAAAKRQAEFDKKKELALEIDRKSVFIGEEKERRDFDLHVRHVVEYDTQFGYVYINICNDADGNVIIIKGGKRFEKGTDIKIKATVIEHSIRDGVKQTRINRPKEI